MDIARIDHSATQGDSALHRAVPGAKLVAFALVLSAAIVSTNVLIVTAVALVLVSLAVALRLPMRPVLALAAYPGIFAALFAFAASTGVLAGSLIVAKAMTAALAAVLLMFTTPYPQVFAPIQRMVPAVIGDVILMTYRSLFLLLEKFASTLTAARLRAGISGSHPVRSAGTITRSLGAVLLYSMDLSQRTHDIMHLRGYDGRLVVTKQASTSRTLDVAVVIVASLLAATAIAWRLWWPVLNPYSWVPTFAAGVMLAVILLAVALRKEPS